MNCDQVFDKLTRGPFPTGAADDRAVEDHLEQCESCRRLAQALQPALELFEEAVGPAESQNLPAYWGPTRTTSHVAPRARRAAPVLAVRGLAAAPRARSAWPWPNLGRFAAALLVGGLLGLGAHAWGPSWPLERLSLASGTPGLASGTPGLASGTPADRGHLRTGWDDPTTWSLLGVAPACRPVSLDPPVVADPTDPANELLLAQAGTGTTEQHCCTQCHVRGQRRTHTGSAVANIIKSCKYCHVN